MILNLNLNEYEITISEAHNCRHEKAVPGKTLLSLGLIAAWRKKRL